MALIIDNTPEDDVNFVMAQNAYLKEQLMRCHNENIVLKTKLDHYKKIYHNEKGI